jgi:hypothetical protein
LPINYQVFAPFYFSPDLDRFPNNRGAALSGHGASLHLQKLLCPNYTQGAKTAATGKRRKT